MLTLFLQHFSFLFPQILSSFSLYLKYASPEEGHKPPSPRTLCPHRSSNAHLGDDCIPMFPLFASCQKRILSHTTRLIIYLPKTNLGDFQVKRRYVLCTIRLQTCELPLISWKQRILDSDSFPTLIALRIVGLNNVTLIKLCTSSNLFLIADPSAIYQITQHRTECVVHKIRSIKPT